MSTLPSDRAATKQPIPFGKVALGLMLGGIGVSYLIMLATNRTTGASGVLFFVTQIGAIVGGILGWRSWQGKVAILGAVLVLAVPVWIILGMWSTGEPM